jgi:hypothetical protein
MNKLQELERIMHKGDMVKKIGNISGVSKCIRSQSVGGIGAVSQLEQNELRNNVVNLQIDQ